jgi:hypothetical protein
LRLLNEQLKNKMLMVENFTQTKDEAYDDDVLEMIVQVDEEFESQVRRNMQSLMKEPRQCIVDNILNYSVSRSSFLRSFILWSSHQQGCLRLSFLIRVEISPFVGRLSVIVLRRGSRSSTGRVEHQYARKSTGKL